MIQILFQNFWIAIILCLIASAVIWRMEAKDRIRADPSLRESLNRLYGGFAFWLSLPFLMMGGGIITGNVEDVSHYLRLDSGNQFIVGFWALIFAEDALFIYWVFFRRGDQRLSLHTELSQARPKFRVAARILAIALPFLHGVTLYQATLLPHFGQLLGENGA